MNNNFDIMVVNPNCRLNPSFKITYLKIIKKTRFIIAIVILLFEVNFIAETIRLWIAHNKLESDGLGAFAYWGTAMFSTGLSLIFGVIVIFLIKTSVTTKS